MRAVRDLILHTSPPVKFHIQPGATAVVVAVVVVVVVVLWVVVFVGVNKNRCAAKGPDRKSKATSFLCFIPPRSSLLRCRERVPREFSYLVPGMFCQLDQLCGR